MYYPATPVEIAGMSESKDLGPWRWRPLGRSWALLQQHHVSGVGLVVVALTGYSGGRPWGETDDRSFIDDYRVWMRGLVDGQLVLPPQEHLSGDLWVFACGVNWTEQQVRQRTPAAAPADQATGPSAGTRRTNGSIGSPTG